MTNAWFLGAANSVPQTENEVRSTVEPIRSDGPAEEQSPPGMAGPDWNEHESDNSGQLIGLSPRMLASDTIDSTQYRPWWAAAASYDHDKIVDDQVATSGTAAAREESGQQGHGTMQYALGIEPVIREGAAFGADYFAAHDAPIQDGAGVYMAPATGISSRWGVQVDAAYAAANSRAAYESSMYNAFLEGSR